MCCGTYPWRDAAGQDEVPGGEVVGRSQGHRGVVGDQAAEGVAHDDELLLVAAQVAQRVQSLARVHVQRVVS